MRRRTAPHLAMSGGSGLRSIRQLAISFALVLLALVAAASAAAPAGDVEGATSARAVAVQSVTFDGFPIRDEAAMVLVGTALIGLAAVLRRAS